MARLNKKTDHAIGIIMLLRQHAITMQLPMVFFLVKTFGRDPFIVLISCLLSLRAKDSVTLPICMELFAHARSPKTIFAIPIPALEKMLYSIGFYKKKARILHAVCEELIVRFHGKVPSSEHALLSIEGIGKKTAALVLGEGFGIPAICVDTHVHRISNRLGLVSTKTPHETEEALKQVLPKQYWIEWNKLLVMWGQNICLARSPHCSRCILYNVCERVNVKQFR